MSKDSISTFPGTSIKITEVAKHIGMIKGGPSLTCLKRYAENGDVCYFQDQQGQQLRAIIIEIGDIVGDIANILVDFIADSGQKIRGYIYRYNSSLLFSCESTLGSYYFL